MVYHPLKKLAGAGLQDILLVSGTEHMGDFVELLGSGRDHNCRLTYRVQDEAGGIAQALGPGRALLHRQPGVRASSATTSSATRSCRCWRRRTAARLGLGRPQAGARPRPLRRRRTAGRQGRSASRRSRRSPKSDFAVVGIYVYPPDVFEVIKTLKPSRRGELEITDVNNHYLKQGRLGLLQPRRLLDRRRHARLARLRERAGPEGPAAVLTPCLNFPITILAAPRLLRLGHSAADCGMADWYAPF